MTLPTPERRSRDRVALNVPVKVRQADGSELPATTRDLSTNGIFLYSEAGLEKGTKLELVVMLPAGLGIGTGGWALCQASVVRVEQASGSRVGVAASLDRIDLLPELQ
jgi:PilZ domain